MLLNPFWVFKAAAGGGDPITATSLTSGSTGVNAESFDTASITPSANKLILLAVSHSRLVAGSVPGPTVTGNGLTWVQVAHTEYLPDGPNWWNGQSVYRAMGASPTTGAVTMDFSSVTRDTVAWSIVEFGNVDTGGTNGSAAVVQAVTNRSAASDTLTVTLAAFGSANNATYGAFGAGDTATSGQWPFNPGTGFTELHDVGEEWTSEGTQWRTDNDTSVDTTTTGTPDGIGGVAIEIKHA